MCLPPFFRFPVTVRPHFEQIYQILTPTRETFHKIHQLNHCGAPPGGRGAPKRRTWGLLSGLAANLGACWTDFFDQLLSQNWFWPKFRLSVLDFSRFTGLGTWKIAKFRFLAENSKILWFLVKNGVLWNWNMLKRGSCGAAEGREKEGLVRRTSISPFSR